MGEDLLEDLHHDTHDDLLYQAQEQARINQMQWQYEIEQQHTKEIREKIFKVIDERKSFLDPRDVENHLMYSRMKDIINEIVI